MRVRNGARAVYRQAFIDNKRLLLLERVHDDLPSSPVAHDPIVCLQRVGHFVGRVDSRFDAYETSR